MAILKLKTIDSPPSPFSWKDITSPSPPSDPSQLAASPTAWLPAREMKVFGAQPLSSTSDIGLVKCKDCDKPILRSCMIEHAASCISANGKSAKVSGDIEGSKKRKASPSPSDPSLPAKKKAKGAPVKAPKGRGKGPVNLDRNCGVINDKGLPCSRSLTCKSHSMGAKRAVEGRSRKYDDLLLDWQRENNPNFVEPVRRESKAEKKEKKEKEKLEKRRLAEEQAAALGIDITKRGALASLPKKTGRKAVTAATTQRIIDSLKDDFEENLDDLDSEAEVDDLVRVVREARDNGLIAQPLAVPCDAGSWFVQSRERARVCRDLLASAFPGTGAMPPGMPIAGLAAAPRTPSIPMNIPRV